MFDHPDFDRHESVVHCFDASTGLKAIVAIHSTAMGPSFGGCRMYPYPGEAAALRDVLRLSRAMSYKCAIVDLPYGGGKSVILGDPRRDKSPALLAAMGRVVESLQGRYIVADDVGTTLDDIATMRRETRFTAAGTASAMQPLAVTAHGVFSAIVAAARLVLGGGSLPSSTGADGMAVHHLGGLTVAVQGLGNVGGPLCELLHMAGARLVVTDSVADRAEAAVERFGAASVAPSAIYDVAADIFAPCALGGVLDADTIPRLAVRVVCGGANNQLATPEDADRLAARGIVYVPDYLVSAGGVIDFAQEAIDDRPESVLAAVGVIGRITGEVLAEAAARLVTPLAVCDRRVRERLGKRL